MISRYTVKLGRSITVSLIIGPLLTSGCGGTNTARQTNSQTLDFSGDHGGLLVCESVNHAQVGNCRLREDGATIVPKFEHPAMVELRLSYQMTCSTTDVETTMRLKDSGPGGSQQTHQLRYSSSDSFVMNTASLPIVLTDESPSRTANRFFNSSRGCGLSISYVALPSSQQIEEWQSLVEALTSLADAKQEIYKFRKDVRFWYDLYVSSPSPGAKSLLEEKIADLEAEGQLVKANSLRQVIALAPIEEIRQPYQSARAELAAMEGDLARLRAKLVYWHQATAAALLAVRQGQINQAVSQPLDI